MVLGTPHDSYDFASGASLLQRLGEESVSVATVELINRGVLTKLVRDPQKAKPGRTLKISEMYAESSNTFPINLMNSQEP